MYGMIHTSDGEIHETSNGEEHVAILDSYGAEVVSETVFKQQPSDAQVQVMIHFLDNMNLPDSCITKIEGWMEDDGCMGFQMIEDGVPRTAYFNRTGNMDGDWN